MAGWLFFGDVIILRQNRGKGQYWKRREVYRAVFEWKVRAGLCVMGMF